MKKSETPEWEIFKRIEKLEALTPTVKDVSTLATFAFILGFFAQARNVSNPRKLKDDWIEYLKTQDLSKQTLEGLGEWLLMVCKEVE